jgi:Protein of unknown function (DUF3096)
VSFLAVVLGQREGNITFTPDLIGFITLGAGVLILIRPNALNYIVAAYLIAVGVITLFNITI